jgi:hypothetical protein
LLDAEDVSEEGVTSVTIPTVEEDENWVGAEVGKLFSPDSPSKNEKMSALNVGTATTGEAVGKRVEDVVPSPVVVPVASSVVVQNCCLANAFPRMGFTSDTPQVSPNVSCQTTPTPLSSNNVKFA